jgi:hypothetical protein
MCVVCSTHGRDDKCIHNFGLKERELLEDVGVDGRIILE